jgi:hypothetical protein
MFKHTWRTSLLLVMFSVFTVFLHAQGSKDAKKEEIQNLVESKHFMFVAQSALPLSEGVRILTSPYDVRLKGDTVESYLPYYGRAFSAVIGTTDQGLTFTSTQSDYDQKPAKKGGWTITIKPKGQNIVQNMVFLVSESGSTSLQVNCRDRQAISYNGYIQEIK